MLEITIQGYELYNDATQEFTTYPEKKIELEHSLMSIAKWESRWHKPFLSATQKEVEEINDYVKCMTLTKGVPDSSYSFITAAQYQEINNYISDPMTATKIKEEKGKGSGEVMTSELIYYYMIASNIPMECQKWHINRLMTLIRVCSIKNQPPKKQNQSEVLRNNAALNAARKKKLNTKG